jgi:hypothetical protein
MTSALAVLIVPRRDRHTIGLGRSQQVCGSMRQCKDCFESILGADQYSLLSKYGKPERFHSDRVARRPWHCFRPVELEIDSYS